MIYKLEFQAHFGSSAQHGDASDTSSGMDPHIPAEFRGCSRQRRHGELIEAVLFGKLSYPLAHSRNFRFCIDLDFPHLDVARLNADGDSTSNGSTSVMPRLSTFAPQK
jgi:hypothetical protein